MKKIISILIIATLLLASVLAMIPASAATPTEFNVMGDSNKTMQGKGEGNVFFFDYYKYLDLGNKFEMTDWGNFDYMIRYPYSGTGSASVSDGVKTSGGVEHTGVSASGRYIVDPTNQTGYDSNGNKLTGACYNQIFGYSFKESVVADAITIYLPADTPITGIDIYGGNVDVANGIFAKNTEKTLLATINNVKDTATTSVTDAGKDPVDVIVVNSDFNEAFELDYIFIAVNLAEIKTFYVYEIELNGLLAKDANDFSELKAQYEIINGLVEKDWKAETWTNLQSAITANDAVNKNATSTAEEIANAAAALKNAIEALEAEPAVKTELSEAIVNAIETYVEADYTPASWAAYADALAAAQNANQKEDIAQSGVDKALADLNAAINALTKLADKTDLTKAIADVDNLNEKDYTPNSWEALRTVKAKAIAVNEDIDATQDEVDAALGALNMAINDLAKPGNSTALMTAITSAKALKKSDYNVANYSWNIFQEVLAEAEAVAADPNATQGDMDIALEALNEKIEGLGKPVSNNTNNNNKNDDADVDEDEDADAEDEETEAPATEAPATQAPATEPAAKKGCGSAVATTAVVVGLVATLGTALVVKKRD